MKLAAYKRSYSWVKYMRLGVWRIVIPFFMAFLFPPVFRPVLLRAFGAKIGVNVRIRAGCYIYDPKMLEICDDVWIGEMCHFNNPEKITIMDNVAIAHEVFFATGSHNFRVENFENTNQPIVIGPECWITSRAFIGPGVTLARNSVVGPNCVVSKTIDQPSVVRVGLPTVTPVE